MPMFKYGATGIIAVLFWLLAFLPGLLVSSLPFRQAIGAGQVTIKSLSLTLLTYTITNIAVLCALAGIAGAATRVLLLQGVGRSERADICCEGILRSFLVYLAFLSGVFIAASNPFDYSQEQYARIAGIISMLSFIANYEPAVFKRVLDTYTSAIIEKAPTASALGRAAEGGQPVALAIERSSSASAGSRK